MLHKTLGIILHTIPYSEKSIIAKIYTKHFGLQSYLVTATRSKKSGNKTQLYQPLALVDIVVSNSEKTKLQKIKELSIVHHYSELSGNILKSSIAMFINEVLYKTLREEQEDEELFDFIFNSLQFLDLKNDNYINFHLSFLVHYSKYLGFFPQGVFSQTNSVFDLSGGKFINSTPNHNYYIKGELCSILFLLMNTNYETIDELTITGYQRNQLINALLLFYQLHISNFAEMKSTTVLKEILS